MPKRLSALLIWSHLAWSDVIWYIIIWTYLIESDRIWSDLIGSVLIGSDLMWSDIIMFLWVYPIFYCFTKDPALIPRLICPNTRVHFPSDLIWSKMFWPYLIGSDQMLSSRCCGFQWFFSWSTQHPALIPSSFPQTREYTPHLIWSCCCLAWVHKGYSINSK